MNHNPYAGQILVLGHGLVPVGRGAQGRVRGVGAAVGYVPLEPLATHVEGVLTPDARAAFFCRGPGREYRAGGRKSRLGAPEKPKSRSRKRPFSSPLSMPHAAVSAQGW